MKLARFDAGAGPRVGIIKNDKVIDIQSAGSRYATMAQIIEAGDAGLAALRDIAAVRDGDFLLSQVQLLAPVERPGKYLAIGMNYQKHLEEADKLGVARAKHQIWFNKQTTCLSGPFDEIETGVTEKLDYEVELGLVVGKRAKGVSPEDALSYIFGYVVANDVSARDWQFHSSTFMMGKSFDTHGPVGPWIVTADEVPDPQCLDLRCFVNGDLRQSNNTANMIHRIDAQIAYLSTAFTLEPGDLIATGTPEGVGIGREPQLFLAVGDVVRCEIDGIGAIENRVIA
ncbi:2-keto-4-pentenoate hydratase/2-oxohepta-3-ene-1,7-dioic acid hydratase (catechol pathway) [Sphingobium sp. AP50]|uniref:fumarylacetoacetate hydrolase family protein n=1 Tax=Sphingobium sp. AP50 TaxID=1884369 RepID=UPI0008D2CDAA|nr:fumarylacetoacetate hydrolase family protein [Sphingobium sp. AP50]SEK00288.1 2-keto-4-pentenoate hydratase/2-oxohepta-3-ene-1,7-dioic acid hydratase (catechol pathway) [Sphingobium sp. AP50]